MKRAVSFLILFTAGMVVYFVGGYWADISSWARSVIKTALPVLLLATTLMCGRIEILRPWRRVSLVLLAASCGFLISWWLSEPIMSVFGVTVDSVSGIAIAKLTDAVLIVIPVLVVAWIGGIGPSSLYLCRGRLGAWLLIGLGAFAVFAVLFLLQSAEQGLTARQLLALAPWTLTFVFANSFMEELHFRGLLLRAFEELLGRHAANICIALFFTLVHAPVDYTPDVLVFLLVVFPLAIIWGYLIQKTGALWGSVLFHAGADLLIVSGIYATYGAG
jgi:membrane protease YdiL (CAAX protease family)